MATIKQIRRRIRSVKNTQQITKAMEMVAAAKLRRSQERVTSARQRTGDTERRAAWRTAERAQRRVIVALADVLRNMLASENVGDLIRLMEEIVTDQKKVNQETDRKAGKAIENILEKK
jgi:hypothetical protein